MQIGRRRLQPNPSLEADSRRDGESAEIRKMALFNERGVSA